LEGVVMGEAHLPEQREQPDPSDYLPRFNMHAAVVVNIDCESGDDIVQRFLRFCIKEEIWSMRLGAVGPKGIVQVFLAADAEVLRAWLVGTGIKEKP
jgi:hypothetical protein